MKNQPEMRITILCGCFLFLSLLLPAQNPLPIGQWRGHLPYRLGEQVAQNEEKIFYSTGLSLVEIDKEDFSVEFTSKVDGLSNIGIDLIRYSEGAQALIVVYDNTVIDLVYDSGEIITLNQIRNFENFVGEKRINDLYVANDSIVYIAATYGVSRLNIAAQEFDFTSFTGISVRNVYVYEGQIYAATAEGIYRIDEDNLNPADFGNWSLLGPEEGFPADYSARAFAAFEGALYLGVDDVAYRYENGSLEELYSENGTTMEFMAQSGNALYVGFQPGRIIRVTPSGDITAMPFNCINNPVGVLEDERGRIWYANRRVRSDFPYQNTPTQGFCEVLNFNSPWSESVWDLSVRDGALWMASGGLNQTFGPQFISDGFSSFIDGRWTAYNRETTEAFLGDNPDSPDDDWQVFVASAIHPNNGKVYMGSYIAGLIEYDPATETFAQYDDDNSSLQIADQDVRVRVGGLAFDEDNNLWVSNNSAPEPLSVLMPGGEWKSFRMPGCAETQVIDLVVDGNGFKWMRSVSNGVGLLLFDEGDMETDTDDRCRTFNSNNSNLPNNDVTCLAADLDGDVWVGTNAGIVIFECGGSAFDPICQGTRRIVEQDGFGAFLLETETITAIAVDGANRKWVGTQNGVFLLSPTGEEQIARFTAENSPLFDNNILDIAVDQSTGEVFIGTEKGLISYQGDAVAGGRTHRQNIKVYPNPVRDTYDGPIAIQGLARNANVKITDVNGKLVFETEALGGQAIWDGRDYNGRRVQTGVYLVFSSADNGFGFNAQPDAAVTKIMVIN
mgnify:CR=1 FL=1